MTEISIVVPTLNEADNMEGLFKRIKNTGLDCEVIVVDSDSNDKTRELAEKASKKYKLKAQIINTGKADLANSAVMGFKASKSDYASLIDADLQHPPEMLKQMLEKIKTTKSDIIIASRFVKGSEVKFSFFRVFVSKVFIFLSHLACPKTIRIKDPSSGFFVFRKKIIENRNLRPLGFRTLLEILVRGDYDKKKVIEVPYVFGVREKGESNFSIKQVKLSLRHLIKLLFSR